MGRLGYRKSKNGCTLCKKRRVKCDEKRPCTACVKHHVVCSLAPGKQPVSTPSYELGEASQNPTPTPTLAEEKSPPPPLPPSAVSTPSSSNPMLKALRSRAPTPPLPPLTGAASDHVENSHEPAADNEKLTTENWIMDLELLHHWTTVTSCTHPAAPRGNIHLQEEVPHQAFKAPFLLHQILTMAALHIAHLRGNDNTSRDAYLMRASSHQGKAVSGMREQLNQGVTRNNGYELYITSALLMACGFASRGQVDVWERPDSWLDGFLGVISLVRGMSVVQQLAHDALSDYPPGHLIDNTPRGPDDVFEHPALVHHLRLLQAEIVGEHEDDGVTAEDRGVVGSSVASLLESMSPGPGPKVMRSQEVRVVFRWLHFVSDGFVERVRCRLPAALVVLLHLCVILQITEPKCWFFEGWGANLAGSIWSVLESTQRWRKSGEWAMEEIRRMAPYIEEQLARDRRQGPT